MKKYHYPLENVLYLREMERDKKQMEFVDADNVFVHEKNVLAGMKLEYDKALNWQSGQISAGGFQSRQVFLEDMEKRMQHQQLRINAAEKIREEKRVVMVEADIEVKRLEKHRDKLKEAWAENIRLEENKQNDEMGNILAYFKEKDS